MGAVEPAVIGSPSGARSKTWRSEGPGEIWGGMAEREPSFWKSTLGRRGGAASLSLHSLVWRRTG
ncbi:hypothetical protein AKJ37_04330 [candidate division MSBL1 archaeon SCGC-AAA259I09]|uniref:Uncharacterized protein n=1 Tax=candidate division MSBL1 archaeon SCGC-AAA259I09 TaxID=1698267 RepID=A0A133URP6_9EURY|nr:hypothetical protein AKJ37_04330 [candidate division MSBL1 archaeon SCGC-AAA259I09]